MALSQFGFDAPVDNCIADELEVCCGHIGIFMRGSDRQIVRISKDMKSERKA